MKIISVVGARPNFIKISPFINEVNKYNLFAKNKIKHILVHTGQHYDQRMSKIFFEALNIPKPKINLNIGSGSHSFQVGKTMIEFEKVLIREKPDWIIVVGDVNATLSCSIAAKKLNLKVCHLEAGLRSFDITMPEEINRIITDRISDLLLTPDIKSSENLCREGIDRKKIKFIGNIMIDTLLANKDIAEKLSFHEIIKRNSLNKNKIIDKNFALVTLHRPFNVDDKNILGNLVEFFVDELSNKFTVLWPLHPRTHKMLKDYNLLSKLSQNDSINLLHPLNYHEFLKLNMISKLVITDSGGLQEECTVLKTPCITLRPNTERPITLTKNGGASILVGNDIKKIKIAIDSIFKKSKKISIPKYWDGKTAKRFLNELLNFKL
tara:strand:- start:73 stop:1212 length:1140 start_codon:yes stop_codon:yes gene_type:complete